MTPLRLRGRWLVPGGVTRRCGRRSPPSFSAAPSWTANCWSSYAGSPGHRAVMAMVTVEIGAADGHVLLRITAPDDHAAVEVTMTADECREFCNHLGSAILCVSRTGVMTA
jgi:hypothetical protein